jgi:hypothetical protein
MKRRVAKEVLFRAASEHFQKHGFAHIKGLFIENNNELVRAVKSVAPFFKIGKYDGGLSPRDELEDGVLTVNLEPPELPVYQHNEMAYSDFIPEIIAFYAKEAAPIGGRTLISDNKMVTNLISSKMEKMFEYGTQYIRNMNDASSDGAEYTNWQNIFFTSDREEATILAKKKFGGDGLCDVNWLKDGSMQCITTLPSFAIHPRNKNRLKVFMSQLYTQHASLYEDSKMYAPWQHLPCEYRPFHTRWGNGEEVSGIELNELGQIYKKAMKTIELETGDLIILDNYLWSHGREAYEGNREVVVCISEQLPVIRENR